MKGEFKIAIYELKANAYKFIQIKLLDHGQTILDTGKGLKCKN